MDYIRFGELYAIPSSNGLSRPSAVRGVGYKMVNMGELFANGIINDIPMERVQMSKKELSKFLLEKGDLLFARQSLVAEGAGKCSYVNVVSEETTFESHLIRVRLNPQKASSKFYYYLFQLPNNPIKSIVNQCAQAGIRGSELVRVKVPYPSLSTQQSVASVLSAYDGLIEVNNKRIHRLEEAISLVFKKWFIWPEKKGWENKKLGEIIFQKKSKLKRWDDMDIVDLSSMPSFSMTLQSYSKPEDFTTNIFKLDKMDLLFGSIRPYLGKAGFAPKDCAVAGTVLHFNVKDDLHYYYTLALITSKYFFDYANCVASGTKMPVIKFEDICRYTVSIPQEKAIFQSFNSIVAPMVEELNSLSVQNANLVNQRDLLLPRLMSGKLSI